MSEAERLVRVVEAYRGIERKRRHDPDGDCRNRKHEHRVGRGPIGRAIGDDRAAEFDHVGDERSNDDKLEGSKVARHVKQLLGRKTKESAQPDRSPGLDRIGQPTIGRRQRPDRIRAPYRREIAGCQCQILGSKTGCKTGPHGCLPKHTADGTSAHAAGLRPPARSLNRNHLLTLIVAAGLCAHTRL